MKLFFNIEQLIFTNFNEDEGYGIVKSTNNSIKESDLLNIIKLFSVPTSKLEIIFSKFNSEYYLYCQCKEYGLEGKGGRTAQIYFCCLILSSDIKELNYDFSLVHTLLSNKIDWEFVNKGRTIETLNIEFNKNDIEKSMLDTLIKNTPIKDLDFIQKQLLSDFQIVSNSDIVDLIFIASSLPIDISKDKILSSLPLYKQSNIDKKKPDILYAKQLEYLKYLDLDNYKKIKSYVTIEKEKTEIKAIKKISKKKSSKEIKPKKDLKKLKIILFLGGSLFLTGLMVQPFISYYKLHTISQNEMNIETLYKYKNLIQNEGFFLNTFTKINEKYQLMHNNNYNVYSEQVMNYPKCDERYIVPINLFIEEYKEDKDMTKIEKKLKDINICTLRKKIFLTYKNNIHDIEKVLFYIKEYNEIIDFKDKKVQKILVKYIIEYEYLYYEKILVSLKKYSNKRVLEMVVNYEKNSLLKYYLSDIQMIKSLMNIGKIKIKIYIKAKNHKELDVSYIDADGKDRSKKVSSNTLTFLDIIWNNNFYLKVNNQSVMKGRVLGLDIKHISETAYLGLVSETYTIRISTTHPIEEFRPTIKYVENYLEQKEKINGK